MRFVSNKKLYLPAVTLIVVVVLLLIMIAVSTIRNLSHQRQTALTFLNSQGVTLLHSLEAAVLTGLRMPMWSEDSVKVLIDEFGKDKNLAFIYLYDRSGIITHASPAALVGTLSRWQPTLSSGEAMATRLQEMPEGNRVYEMAKRFSPLSADQNYPMGSMRDRMDRMMGASNHHAGDTLVLGLSMAQFEAAHRADLHHAMIMGATLLLLGTGAFFFTFVIQNYYLVELALDKSRDYLKLVMASMSNGMLSIDTKGNIITINDSAGTLLGIDEQEIQQIDLRSIVDFHSSGIQQTLTDGIPAMEREIVLEKPSGRVVLSVSVSPIIDENNKSSLSGAVIMLRDLTEIKRLQEKVRRSEKLAAIGELAAGIAHEVRNPLSSIRGFAQYLKRVLTDRPKECEYAELMVKEVDRINNVVTNLLSFARPVQPEPAPTDIQDFLTHILRLVQQDARQRGVAIRLDVSPDQDMSRVALDENQMTQVMLNLVLNALQAVDDGGHISVGADLHEGGRLELSVEDDGPGIPPDRVKRIFDPFFTTKEKGTGLGMAIVQMIIESLNGEIQVISPAPGKDSGCRIVLQLPGANNKGQPV